MREAFDRPQSLSWMHHDKEEKEGKKGEKAWSPLIPFKDVPLGPPTSLCPPLPAPNLTYDFWETLSKPHLSVPVPSLYSFIV